MVPDFRSDNHGVNSHREAEEAFRVSSLKLASFSSQQGAPPTLKNPRPAAQQSFHTALAMASLGTTEEEEENASLV